MNRYACPDEPDDDLPPRRRPTAGRHRSVFVHHSPHMAASRPADAPAALPAVRLPSPPLWERLWSGVVFLLSLAGIGALVFGVTFYVTCWMLGVR